MSLRQLYGEVIEREICRLALIGAEVEAEKAEELVSKIRLTMNGTLIGPDAEPAPLHAHKVEGLGSIFTGSAKTWREAAAERKEALEKLDPIFGAAKTGRKAALGEALELASKQDVDRVRKRHAPRKSTHSVSEHLHKGKRPGKKKRVLSAEARASIARAQRKRWNVWRKKNASEKSPQ